MALLRCCVQECINNKSNYCSLEGITVGGATTYQSDGTSCESFINKEKALVNNMAEGNPYIDITCRAKNCIYNMELKCIANSIDIGGYTSETSDETQCSTFNYK